jgi:hypothetical protein
VRLALRATGGGGSCEVELHVFCVGEKPLSSPTVCVERRRKFTPQFLMDRGAELVRRQSRGVGKFPERDLKVLRKVSEKKRSSELKCSRLRRKDFTLGEWKFEHWSQNRR